VRESVDFYHRHPEIEAMILADQRTAALAAKHDRARRENDRLLQGLSFEWFEESDPAGCSLELGVGRPRMEPVVVFVMLMLRGRIGGPCSRSARELLLESRSLRRLFC